MRMSPLGGRIENDFLAREITKHPMRFAGFAHLQVQDANAAGDELSRCIELWERVEALGVPNICTPTRPPRTPGRDLEVVGGDGDACATPTTAGPRSRRDVEADDWERT